MEELIGPANFQEKFLATNQPARDEPEVEPEEGGHPEDVETGAGPGAERERRAGHQGGGRGLEAPVPRPEGGAQQLPPSYGASDV
jgi:hypothetical protein